MLTLSRNAEKMAAGSRARLTNTQSALIRTAVKKLRINLNAGPIAGTQRVESIRNWILKNARVHVSVVLVRTVLRNVSLPAEHHAAEQARQKLRSALRWIADNMDDDCWSDMVGEMLAYLGNTFPPEDLPELAAGWAAG